jgi:deoxyribodipyrimidine photo-lyase
MTEKSKLIIYWCRRDFRLEDNKALSKAVEESLDLSDTKTGKYFLPVFVLEDYMTLASTDFQFGFPSRLFLSEALPRFSSNFKEFLLLEGKGAQSLIDLNKTFDIKVYVNEDVYIDFYKQIEKLKKHKIDVLVFDDQLTVKRDTKTKTGNLYSVFTPFKRAVWSEFMNSDTIKKIDLSKIKYPGKDLLDLIEKKVSLDSGFLRGKFSDNRKIEINNEKKIVIDIDNLLDYKPDLKNWYFDEKEAQKLFKNYIKNSLKNYKRNRDSLEKDTENLGSTSKMSLALAWGLVSARWMKTEIQKEFKDNFSSPDSTDEENGPLCFLSELIWREFYKYLLYNYPELMSIEFQEKFRNKIKWVEEKEAKMRFESWIKGETGYEVVDAAMIQLAKTGWMHNRARMIVASVLTKNLGVDWRWGQEYFRAMLIDLDEASNCGGWQWGASVGADPKPIRIFNPYLQRDNYDASGAYQKLWLGEERYFFPIPVIVDHKEAREEALKRYGLGGPFRDY